MNRRAAVLLVSVGTIAGTAPLIASAADRSHDLAGFWAVKFERRPSGRQLIDELPKGTVMINDTGAGELGRGDFGGLKLTPAAKAKVRKYDPAAELKRQNSCIAPTVPFYMQAPFPMEIYPGRDLIVFKMEYFDMYRVIFMDGRRHPPADAPHYKSGHSIGHWNGNTLVVDTTHIEAGTFLNNGLDHSKNLHMQEKFRLSPDGSTLWSTELYWDPQVFEGPAARYLAWTRRPGRHVFPYDCDPTFDE